MGKSQLEEMMVEAAARSVTKFAFEESFIKQTDLLNQLCERLSLLETEIKNLKGQERKWLTIQETSIEFQVSVSTLRRWIKSGKLAPGKHYKFIAGKYLIDVASFKKLL